MGDLPTAALDEPELTRETELQRRGGRWVALDPRRTATTGAWLAGNAAEAEREDCERPSHANQWSFMKRLSP